MKVSSTVCLVTSILLLCVHSAVVIDMAGRFSNYTCFKNSGISQIIVRAYHSYGAIDLDAKSNILQSNAAGLSTDVYMFPCRGKDPATQVKQLVDYLNSMTDSTSAFAYATGTVWLDIQTNPSSGCSWTQGTFETNCQFIKTLVDQLTTKGRSVGIYASHYMWLQILGAVDKCNIFTNLPLWYAHYDQKLDWDDWPQNKFGGWAQPTMKQYTGDAPLCGFKVDLSYY